MWFQFYKIWKYWFVLAILLGTETYNINKNPIFLFIFRYLCHQTSAIPSRNTIYKNTPKHLFFISRLQSLQKQFRLAWIVQFFMQLEDSKPNLQDGVFEYISFLLMLLYRFGSSILEILTKSLKNNNFYNYFTSRKNHNFHCFWNILCVSPLTAVLAKCYKNMIL